MLVPGPPESADSSYVIRMQAQLCKAMHSMGILEHQLEILNQHEALRSNLEKLNEELRELERKDSSYLWRFINLRLSPKKKKSQDLFNSFGHQVNVRKG